MVVLAARQLYRRSVLDIDQEQVPAALLPTDSVESGGEAALDAGRVALHGAGLLAIGDSHTAYDDKPGRVG